MEGRLSCLRQEVQRYKGSSYAKTTQATYRTHLRTYFRFCCFFGCTPVPAERDTVCCYTAFLARSLSPSSIGGYLNIIRVLHLDAGLPNPLENNWEVTLIRRGIARQLGTPPKQKLPITLAILRSIFPLLDFSSTFEISFWAACLIAFFGFFRKSTILPVSHTSVGGILRGDVINFNGISFELVVRHTKTIQFGQRILVLPFHRCADSRLCPVRALWSHLTSSSLSSDQHIFSYVIRGSVRLLTHPLFVNKLKSLIVAIGKNPRDYSAHSFRRGGSTYAFSLNMPLMYVKSRGDWKSNCVERYIEIDKNLAMNAAVLLAEGSAWS